MQTFPTSVSPHPVVQDSKILKIKIIFKNMTLEVKREMGEAPGLGAESPEGTAEIQTLCSQPLLETALLHAGCTATPDAGSHGTPTLHTLRANMGVAETNLQDRPFT